MMNWAEHIQALHQLTGHMFFSFQTGNGRRFRVSRRWGDGSLFLVMDDTHGPAEHFYGEGDLNRLLGGTEGLALVDTWP